MLRPMLVPAKGLSGKRQKARLKPAATRHGATAA